MKCVTVKNTVKYAVISIGTICLVLILAIYAYIMYLVNFTSITDYENTTWVADEIDLSVSVIYRYAEDGTPFLDNKGILNIGGNTIAVEIGGIRDMFYLLTTDEDGLTVCLCSGTARWKGDKYILKIIDDNYGFDCDIITLTCITDGFTR